jgi:hypothetical protein
MVAVALLGAAVWAWLPDGVVRCQQLHIIQAELLWPWLVIQRFILLLLLLVPLLSAA